MAQRGKLLPGGSFGLKMTLGRNEKGRVRMSVDAHLAELEQQHRALETKIAEAHTHPSMDDLEIASWKRRKLRVKDALARLKN